MNDFTVVWVHHAGQLAGRGKGSAFAAVKADGRVIWWGNLRIPDQSTILPHLSQGVVNVSATSDALAAIKEDGHVITWGGPDCGGDSLAVASLLVEGVVHVSASSSAFAAIKEDGRVITWGGPDEGGDSSAVADLLAEGVAQLLQIC